MEEKKQEKVEEKKQEKREEEKKQEKRDEKVEEREDEEKQENHGKPDQETSHAPLNLVEEEGATMEDLNIDNILSLTDLQTIPELSCYPLNEIITSKGLDGKVGWWG